MIINLASIWLISRYLESIIIIQILSSSSYIWSFFQWSLCYGSPCVWTAFLQSAGSHSEFSVVSVVDDCVIILSFPISSYISVSLSWLLSVIPDLKLHFSVIILSLLILSYISVSLSWLLSVIPDLKLYFSVILVIFVIKLTIKCNRDHPVYIKYDTETIQSILSMIIF